jgi:hypothetical protein
MVTATIALGLGATRGGVMARLVGVGWSVPLLIASGLACVASILALLQRRYRLARIGAGAWVTLVLWGWVMGAVPFDHPAEPNDRCRGRLRGGCSTTRWSCSPSAA